MEAEEHKCLGGLAGPVEVGGGGTLLFLSRCPASTAPPLE